MTDTTEHYADLASAFDTLTASVASDLSTVPTDDVASVLDVYRSYADGRTARSEWLAVQRDATDGASDPFTRSMVAVAAAHVDDAIRASAGRSATDAAPTLADVASDRAAYLLDAAASVLLAADDGDADGASAGIRAAILDARDLLPDDAGDADAISAPASVRRYDWTTAPSGAGRGGRSLPRDLSTVPHDTLTLTREYDGTEFVATLDVASGTFTVDGQSYDSPSAAAADGAGAGSTNGWTFWHYDGAPLADRFDADGQWID